ncbi:extracellular ribonuclease LE-like [Cucurbita moschata]|uniref:Extracellular ribonuclease LE-like n=1 Tax=Cucurbita moschata TaxID=3662 RepID=A0A6J1G1Q4_CUCMO|nr:extracellular ribonuclease LE-like [Cucurbita moschata]
MARIHLFVLFLSSLILFVNAQFEYFQMVQQWPLATCTGSIFPNNFEHSYQSQLRPIGHSENCSAQPHWQHIHRYHVIEGAIQAAIGKKPGLRCNINKKTRNSQLHEIVLCFDKNGVTLIDCPFPRKCPTQFKWLLS